MNYTDLRKVKIPISKVLTNDSVCNIINRLPREYSRCVLAIIMNYYLNHPCKNAAHIISMDIPYSGVENDNIELEYLKLPQDLQILLKEYISLIVDYSI